MRVAVAFAVFLYAQTASAQRPEVMLWKVAGENRSAYTAEVNNNGNRRAQKFAFKGMK